MMLNEKRRNECCSSGNMVPLALVVLLAALVLGLGLCLLKLSGTQVQAPTSTPFPPPTPTLAPTAAPTVGVILVPTIEPTQMAVGTLVCVKANAKLRAGPSSTSPIIGGVAQGQILVVLASTDHWLSTQNGWIYADLVERAQ